MKNNKFALLLLLISPMSDVLASDESSHHLINVGVNLELKKAGSHGMLGTRTEIAIQPFDRHRLKLHSALFSNDQGASTSGGSSFGLGDFFACLFGSCPDEDYSTNSGGNYFYDYEERAVIYQYQLHSKKLGANSSSEVWAGLGASSTERTVNQYQINNGDNYDVISRAKDKGVAWGVDYMHRYKVWYWQASLSGSTSSESYGGSLGVGLGF
jgi:hypothetical protein